MVEKRTGVIKSIGTDQATVDFGGGDVYGIVFRRLKKA